MTARAHLLVNFDDHLYHAWQGELFEHTRRRAGVDLPVVSLVSRRGPEQRHEFPGESWVEKGYQQIAPWDDYAIYNKPYSIRSWLERTRDRAGADDRVLIVDPDFLFVGPADLPPDGSWAQSYGYMTDRTVGDAACRATATPIPFDELQPVGVPVLMARHQLASMAERFWDALVAIRADPQARQAAGWVADMWAFNIAAAEAGIRFNLWSPAAFLRDDIAPGQWMIHYCDGVTVKIDKREYHPWNRPFGLTTTAIELVRAVAELRTLRGGEILVGK
jgi:hypothetical protein